MLCAKVVLTRRHESAIRCDLGQIERKPCSGSRENAPVRLEKVAVAKQRGVRIRAFRCSIALFAIEINKSSGALLQECSASASILDTRLVLLLILSQRFITKHDAVKEEIEHPPITSHNCFLCNLRVRD